MATPPRPSSVEVQAAMARVWQRHERAEDPQRAELGSEPRDVLSYLRRRSGSVPRATAADDVWDELILSAALHWEGIERERALLRRARHLGVSLAELAAHLGIRTRQGMQDYLDRLDALVEIGAPDVQVARGKRRRRNSRVADQQWLDEHRDQVRDALRELVRQGLRTLPDGWPAADPSAEAEDLGLLDLRADLEAGVLDPGTMGLVGVVVGELRTDPTVASLDRGHGLHRALRAVERIRSSYAAARQPQ